MSLRSWTQLIGPGLVMGGAAIGGGEWMAGPLTTAKYGGAILWLSTLSILGQVIYNLEISRYTLYSGESIFTGKFRLLPGPFFWLGAVPDARLRLGLSLPRLGGGDAAGRGDGRRDRPARSDLRGARHVAHRRHAAAGR